MCTNPHEHPHMDNLYVQYVNMCLHVFIWVSVGAEPFQASHAPSQVKVSCQNAKICVIRNNKDTYQPMDPE